MQFVGKVQSMRISSKRLVLGLWLILFLALGGSAGALLQEATPSDKLLAAADALIPVAARLRGLEPIAPIQKGIKKENADARDKSAHDA